MFIQIELIHGEKVIVNTEHITVVGDEYFFTCCCECASCS